MAFVLIAWVVSRMVMGLIGYYALALAGRHVDVLAMFQQWDANSYLSLARTGYVPPFAVTGFESGQSNVNFFPLMSMGVWLLARVVPPLLPAGLLFANGCVLVAAVLLHRLAILRADVHTANWSVLSMMFMPGSFVLAATMSEAPFLAFSIYAAYFQYQARYGAAALSSAVLSITRLTGASQALGFALDWGIARHAGRPAPYRQLFLIVLIPIPLFIYFGFMFHLTGDALAAVHSNFAFWNQRVGYPLQNFAMLFTERRAGLQIQSIVGLGMLCVLLSQARMFTLGEWLFLVVNIVLFSSGVSRASLIRYMVALYPVHLAMGRACARCAAGRALFLGFAMANGALTIVWVYGLESFM